MNTPHELMPAPPRALQLFEPDPHTAYTIEMTAYLVDVPRHTILVYYKYHWHPIGTQNSFCGPYCLSE